MLNLLIGFILVVLGFQAFPVSLGNDFKTDSKRSVQQISIQIIMQLLMMWLGLFLGNKFLYLPEDYQYIIVFIGLFLVGIRIAFDSFAVRRGERTFSNKSSQNVVLSSTAQSINTFLSGIILSMFNINPFTLFIILGISVLLFSTAATFIKLNKLSLAFSSFIYLFGGGSIIAIAIYLGFFIK